MTTPAKDLRIDVEVIIHHAIVQDNNGIAPLEVDQEATERILQAFQRYLNTLELPENKPGTDPGTPLQRQLYEQHGIVSQANAGYNQALTDCAATIKKFREEL